MTVQKKILDLTGSQYLVQKVKSAINDVDSSLSTHIADTDIHVTTADKNKWNNQTYVFRYSSTALVASSTNSNALLDNTDNLKVGDKVIDSSGVLFSITAIDTQNSTFTIGTALVDLAQDSDVVHKSGDETINGNKIFSNGTLIVNNSIGSNIHGEIKFAGSRPGYIVADNASDGVFDNNNCGVSILLQDAGKPLHIGGYKVDSNGRVFVDNTNKNPVLSITSGLIRTATLVPENDIGNTSFRILSQIDYANGDTSKVLDVRFVQYGNVDGSSAVYSNDDGKTSLGASSRRWSKIYGTEYYYGSNNVEFSTKFVTTDTNQDISGNKTFLDVPITLKSSTAELGVTGGNTKVIFTDKNLLNLASITFGSYESSKLSYCRFHIYDKDSNNQEVENFIEFSYVNNNQTAYFRPNKSNFASLGTVSNRWSKVYANEYYYGSNNVEFSTKFVTTDTNQTIHGAKTFNNHTYIYDPDATATTPNLYLRSSKIEISSQGNTSGDQNLTYLDKNKVIYANVKGAIQSNGSAVKIRAIAKDSSDNLVINELQMSAYTNGDKSIFPSYSNEIDLGTSSYKWKSFNGVEPSSLSLPSDRSARIDISSYITNLGNGDNNQYIVPANGYIWLHFTSINSALCYAQTSGGLTNYAQTFARYSGDGQLYAFFPVRKNDYFIVQIYTASTAVVQNAYFIPCQGNV